MSCVRSGNGLLDGGDEGGGWGEEGLHGNALILVLIGRAARGRFRWALGGGFCCNYTGDLSQSGWQRNTERGSLTDGTPRRIK